jgi:hypothetical protein
MMKVYRPIAPFSFDPHVRMGMGQSIVQAAPLHLVGRRSSGLCCFVFFGVQIDDRRGKFG